ncbi:3-ketoacyl-ACP reductase [Thermoanaerobacterium thermosaccharolyticum]|uniref:3-ketoacyl-ACP reductase n=1 Tax=Thermoanaerobacterium thermosaccharolyticum TaxID=1517 RepID=UPI003DA7E568
MEKIAIVTGGGRGIGLAIVRQLAQDGFRVAIMGSSPEINYKESLDKIRETGAEILYVSGSIANSSDRQLFVELVVKKFGKIDVLVNNAGIAPLARVDLLDMSEESFDRVIEVNLKGTMFFTQLVAKQMISQKREGEKKGTIINISSISSVVSSINRGEYCISKAGVSMLTTLYADRLAPEGIFVYEVRPGIIDTKMTAKTKDKYNDLIEQGILPIKRWGKPEDIANVVSLLCSDKMTYSTGDHIYVDGGFHIQRL